MSRTHYKPRSKKRFFRFFAFYSVLALLLISLSTFSTYQTETEQVTTAEVAKWQVKVNNIDLSEEQESQETKIIELVPSNETQTTTDNKLAPGKTGSFNIEIDPTGTDVSIQYAIGFDMSNLPEDIKLTSYEVVETAETYEISGNQITGEINLISTSEGLTEDSKRTLKVNWEWEDTENTEIPSKDTEYNISASITIKQKIN